MTISHFEILSKSYPAPTIPNEGKINIPHDYAVKAARFSGKHAAEYSSYIFRSAILKV